MRLVKRLRPSPAMIVACLALVVALTGTGMAAVVVLVPKNSVGTAQVIDHSLLKQDFKAGQLPAGARGAPGPSIAFTQRSGSPLLLDNGLSIVGGFRLDPGSYVILAKGYVVGNNAVATCLLSAENDVDESKVSSAANYPGTISNALTHTFTSQGRVGYQCRLDSGTGTLNNMQLVAIRVGSVAIPSG
jgi:hypothetical protein